jgi:DHA3 family macrolide efflux protein-like MFS transporter
VIGNRNFMLFWQAQLVSQFGNQAFAIGALFWTTQVAHSATMTGLISMAGVLPLIVLGPFTGTFIDRRRSRLGVIVACDLSAGLVVSLFGLRYLWGAQAMRPAALFMIALLVGVAGAFFDPASNAFVPDLVPRGQLEAANALRQSSRQVTNLTARGLGGILYALVGPAALFLLDGVSFLFAGASEMFISVPDAAAPRPAAAASDRGFFDHAAEGFRYVAARPGMMTFLLTVAIFNALLMPMSILLPEYATASLRGDARWYGFLLAAISAGAIAGCAVVGAAKLDGPSRRAALIASLAALAVALAVLGQIEVRWIGLAIVFATGVLTAIVNVLALSIIQRGTASEFRGRIVGLHAMLTRLLAPIALVGGGVVADMTGRNVPVVFGVCGALALLSAIPLMVRRTARAFLAVE